VVALELAIEDAPITMRATRMKGVRVVRFREDNGSANARCGYVRLGPVDSGISPSNAVVVVTQVLVESSGRTPLFAVEDVYCAVENIVFDR